MIDPSSPELSEVESAVAEALDVLLAAEPVELDPVVRVLVCDNSVEALPLM